MICRLDDLRKHLGLLWKNPTITSIHFQDKNNLWIQNKFQVIKILFIETATSPCTLLFKDDLSCAFET